MKKLPTVSNVVLLYLLVILLFPKKTVSTLSLEICLLLGLIFVAHKCKETLGKNTGYKTMKDHIAIFLLLSMLFVMGHNARAQSDIGSWDFGFTAGMNISTHTDKYNYSGDVAFTPDMAAGYQVGLLVRGRFSESLAIQLEPSIVKLGARYQETFLQQDLEYHTESWTRLVYLQLPLMAQYSIDPFVETLTRRSSPYTRYHLTGGLFGGYLLNAQFKGMNYRSPNFEAFQEGRFSEDVLIHYSKYDAGVVFGMGFEYDQTIGFDARMQYTMLQTYNSTPAYKPQNMALMFSVTYLIMN